MKIRLTVDLELPDDTPLVAEAYNESLGQLLSDAYTHYIVQCHSEDALKWCAKGRVGSENEQPGAKQIYLYHKTWTDICSKAKWNFKVVKAAKTVK